MILRIGHANDTNPLLSDTLRSLVKLNLTRGWGQKPDFLKMGSTFGIRKPCSAYTRGERNNSWSRFQDNKTQWWQSHQSVSSQRETCTQQFDASSSIAAATSSARNLKICDHHTATALPSTLATKIGLCLQSISGKKNLCAVQSP